MKSLFPLPVLLMAALLASGGAVAQSLPQESKASLPAGATLDENGTVELPPGAADALWMDFYSGISVALDTTARLRAALEKHGFRFTRSESDAKASVNISGFVRLYNDGRSYDTGKIFLGDLLEPNVDFSRHSATSAQKDPLHFDAGVAQQATRALNDSGVSGGVAGGIGIAILTDWLADATGLRGVLNGGFRKLVGAKGGRPILFCGTDCKRTTHEVELTLSVWQGRVAKSYTLTVRQVADDINEEAVAPLTEFGLSHLLDKLYQASRT